MGDQAQNPAGLLETMWPGGVLHVGCAPDTVPEKGVVGPMLSEVFPERIRHLLSKAPVTVLGAFLCSAGKYIVYKFSVSFKSKALASLICSYFLQHFTLKNFKYSVERIV